VLHELLDEAEHLADYPGVIEVRRPELSHVGGLGIGEDSDQLHDFGEATL
jgi:hypothetical protein